VEEQPGIWALKEADVPYEAKAGSKSGAKV
jgi:hypothetical protein